MKTLRAVSLASLVAVSSSSSPSQAFTSPTKSAATAAATPPNIVHVLLDDFGWNAVNYHEGGEESQTPTLDYLRENGVELDRFYTHKICSPSRCAVQSGRSPIHVNVQNVKPEVVNADDKLGGYQGIPLNMTLIPEVLKSIYPEYSTHFVGKWDVGMATISHTPWERGYDTFLGYFHHSNDYWSFDEGKCGLKSIKDLWRHDPAAGFSGPALDLVNDGSCSQDMQSPKDRRGSDLRCVYEEELLLNRVLDVVEEHKPGGEGENSGKPFFLFWSPHLTHMPLQVPDEYLDKFDGLSNSNKYRQSMRAMQNYVDGELGAVVSALQASGQWSNTLLVVHADNGGEILTVTCGGNNWPLRGGKFSNWEGGVRVVALASGGLVPEQRRGFKEERLVAAEDWLATYAGLARRAVQQQQQQQMDGAVVDVPLADTLVDSRAVEAGLPDYDSIDQWGVIAGSEGPDYKPRQEVIIGDTSTVEFNGDGDTLVGGVLRADGFKVLLGAHSKLFRIGQDVMTGPLYPNASTPTYFMPDLVMRKCGRSKEDGCLFNVFDDPSEEHNLAETNPDVFKELISRIDELQKTVYSPDRGKKSGDACDIATGDYGGFWGPFLK